jgi:hypothetical protein
MLLAAEFVERVRRRKREREKKKGRRLLSKAIHQVVNLETREKNNKNK